MKCLDVIAIGVGERLTGRCRSNGQFASALISDIDLKQLLDTWPRNMKHNFHTNSDILLNHSRKITYTLICQT